MTGDPRTRRAEQLRSLVLDTLRKSNGSGLSSWTLWRVLRDAFPGSVVTDRQVGHALTVLKREGKVRLTRPYWFLVVP